jgi:hypothetical protein
MNRKALLDELTQDVLLYVMQGSFPESRFVDRVKPHGLDERFNDFEMLARLHFILRPDVIDFVESLPRHLREIKTQTENVTYQTRGEVEGRINWSQTYQRRYGRNPDDVSLFVCENRSEHYDIDENLVLKKLLSVIYETLNECDSYLQSDYQWVTQRWKENLELVDMMKDIFERNVHVTRIRQPEEYEPTARMLDRARESRMEIYRAAASLLREFEATLEGDEAAIRKLLDETAITPDDNETLLELFVLFKYISALERLQDDQFTLETIESGKQEIARMKGGPANREIALYHDSSARDRDVSFNSAPEGDESEFSRHEMVQHEAVETARSYFKNDDLGPNTNRPDVIVLEITEPDRTEYLITEVKDSTRSETVRTGIKETLEYLAFLRQDGQFVFDSDSNYFGNGYNGVLVVQDMPETETAAFEEQREQRIRVLQASEVEARLDSILERVL